MPYIAPQYPLEQIVYIIGAQCTGKTTLVNALEASLSTIDPSNPAQHLKPVVIREVARTVLKENNFTREDITTSPSRALQLQLHILQGQFAAETTTSKEGYICDRSGLDPIAYARKYVGKDAAEDMLSSKSWLELEKRMKLGVVILCEAGCTWLVDDGTRLMPTGEDEWMMVDSVFRELLEEREIHYIVVPSHIVSLTERIAIVKAAMGLQRLAI